MHKFSFSNRFSFLELNMPLLVLLLFYTFIHKFVPLKTIHSREHSVSSVYADFPYICKAKMNLQIYLFPALQEVTVNYGNQRTDVTAMTRMLGRVR